MRQPSLEVTFRGGRALAAYVHLPGRVGRRAWKSREIARGLVLDLSRGGEPIGIEITEPSRITVTAINRVLRRLGMPLMKARDLAPMHAA
jgi:hypothetical protein